MTTPATTPIGYIYKGLLITMGIVLLLAGAVFSLPYLLDANTLRQEATSRLSQWTESNITVRGRVQISYFPGVTLYADDVKIEKLNALKKVSKITTERLEAEINLLPLLFGRIEIGKLILEQPKIKMVRPKQDTPDGDPAATKSDGFQPIARFLRKTSVGRIKIRNGTIIIPRVNQPPEKIEHLQAKAQIEPDELSTMATGSLLWRGGNLKFDIATDAVQTIANAAKAPLRLALNGDQFSASFVGDAVFTDTVQLDGKIALKISDVRHCASWIGEPLPPGSAFNTFSGEGNFTWTEDRVDFSKAYFILDGNRADGAVGLSFKKRPTIEGTLDLEKLILTDYFAKKKQEHVNSKLKTPLAQTLNTGLFRKIDADLRLSTGTVIIDNIKTGRSAATMTARSGEINMNIAEMALFGGMSTFQVKLDMQPTQTRYTVKGKMSNIFTERLLAQLDGPDLVYGKANVTADLEATGKTIGDLLSSVSGSLKLDMPAGGRASIDLTDIMKQAARQQTNGWGKATHGETQFSKLTSDFDIVRGSLQSRQFNIQTDNQTVKGQGVLDLNSKSMDWRLTVSSSKSSLLEQNAKNDATLDQQLTLKGPWERPMITDHSGTTNALPEKHQTQPEKRSQKTLPGAKLKTHFYSLYSQ